MTGVVGSAIGAGASLIGGAGTTAAQNAANKEIAQMNNAFNEKMFDKQVAYNKEMYQQQLGDQWKFYDDTKQNAWKLYEDQKQNNWDLVKNQQQFQMDMWNKTNEYNSPAALRERIEAAELNPYAMLNSSSFGTASTMSGSAGAAPSGAAPPVALHLYKVLRRLPLPPTLLIILVSLPDLAVLLTCCLLCLTAR